MLTAAAFLLPLPVISAAVFIPMIKVLSVIAAGSASIKSNQQMIRAVKGQPCPDGTSDAGVGHCRTWMQAQYFRAKNKSRCPVGSSFVGAGYCRMDE